MGRVVSSMALLSECLTQIDWDSLRLAVLDDAVVANCTICLVPTGIGAKVG